MKFVSFLKWPLLWYLRFFAKIALRIHKPYVIGIAGAVGKSSTKYAVHALLKNSYPTQALAGNSETGLPLGILGLGIEGYSVLQWIRVIIQAPFGLFFLRGIRYLIVEMGTDAPYSPKNMTYLLSIVHPDLALFLNVQPTHIQQFEEGLDPQITGAARTEAALHIMAKEDGKIITHSGCEAAIYHQDDEYISAVIHNATTALSGTTLYTFGSSSQCTITYTDYHLSTNGTTFQYIVHTPNNEEPIQLTFNHQILPQEYQELFAATLLVGSHIGMTMQEMTTAIERNFSLPKGRSGFFFGQRNSIIIDSSYNSSPAALNAFLDMVARLTTAEQRPVIVLCGDMNEMGSTSPEEHTAIAQSIYTVADYCYFVGPMTRQYTFPTIQQLNQTVPKLHDIQWFSDAKEAGIFLQQHLPADAIVLVKGSQGGIFLEEAIKQILANSADINQLCRQDEYWLEYKKKIHLLE